MFEEFSITTFFLIFFGFCAIIILVVIVGAVYLARAQKSKPATQEERVIEKETIKEVVLIPCLYCGSLMPQSALFCSTCGAGRKA